ncbi:MAG: hypothetical protein Q9159_004584 [Coniocarpon cinnabarinum]
MKFFQREQEEPWGMIKPVASSSLAQGSRDAAPTRREPRIVNISRSLKVPLADLDPDKDGWQQRIWFFLMSDQGLVKNLKAEVNKNLMIDPREVDHIVINADAHLKNMQSSTNACDFLYMPIFSRDKGEPSGKKKIGTELLHPKLGTQEWATINLFDYDKLTTSSVESSQVAQKASEKPLQEASKPPAEASKAPQKRLANPQLTDLEHSGWYNRLAAQHAGPTKEPRPTPDGFRKVAIHLSDGVHSGDFGSGQEEGKDVWLQYIWLFLMSDQGMVGAKRAELSTDRKLMIDPTEVHYIEIT